MSSQRNASIQGLRGFAALSVMYYHIYLTGIEDHLAVWNEKISPFVLFFGGGAVCLFFCISGLLILQSLIKHNDWHVFAVNRIKRIYPLFIVLHIFSFTWGPIRGKAAWMASVGPKPLDWLYHFFTNLFFLPGVFPLTLVQQLAWSLSYEAAFYVVSCFIFVGVKKVTAKQNLGYPMVALGGAAAIALLVFHPFFWFFLVGITTYFLLEKGLANKVPGGPFGLALLLAYIGIYRFTVIGYQPFYGVAFFASVILAALFFQTVVTEKGWFSSFLSTKPLQFLGKISYSLYLCGGLAAIPSRYVSLAAHHRLSGTPSLVAAFVVGTLTIVPICWVCYELFEVRLTRFLFPKKLPA